MKKSPFMYFSLKLINKWHTTEKGFSEGLTGRTIDREALRKSMNYFGISRSFPNIGNPANLDIVAQLITDTSRGLNSKNSAIRVEDLARKFEQEFGGYNLVAASKLLWLRNKSDIIILDKHSRRALRKLGHSFRDNDYTAYLNAWTTEFSKAESHIKAASAKLMEAQPYSAMWMASPEDFQSIIKSGWFMRRVFDLFLWEAGGNTDAAQDLLNTITNQNQSKAPTMAIQWEKPTQ